MKKTLTACILLLALCLSLSACGGISSGVGLAKGGETLLADVTAAPVTNAEGETVALSYLSSTLANIEDIGAFMMTGLCLADEGMYIRGSAVDENQDIVDNLYLAGLDGEVRKIDAAPLESGNVTNMCALDGRKWLITSISDSGDSMEFELWSSDDSGWTSLGSLDTSDGATSLCGMCAVGNLLFIGRSDYQNIYTLEAYTLDGTKEYSVDLNSSFDIVGDGENLYISTHSRLEAGLSVCKFDLDKREMTEAASFSNGTLLACDGEKIYVSDSTSVYECDTNTGNSALLFHWASCGLVDGGTSLFPLPDGGFMACGMEKAKLISPSANGPRTQVTLATNGNSIMYSHEAMNFNEVSTEYELIVKEYSSYPNPEQVLAAEIAAGNSPDLIDLATFSSDLVHSDIMMDLMTLLENDPDISASDMLSGPLKAMQSEDGGLYAIAPTFYVRTLICKTGTAEVKNFNGVADALERLGTADMAFAKTLSRDDFLALAFCCGGVESYSLEDITAILKYASDLPEETDYSEYYENLASGKQRFINETSGYALHFLTDMLNFGGTDYNDVTVYGSIFREGTGTVMPFMYLAVPTSTEHVDGAWAFIKTLLTRERTDQNEYPLYKPVYDYGRVEAEEWISRGGELSYGADEYYYCESTDFFELSDYMLENVNGIYSSNATILNIVIDDAAAFFAGAKTAEECAELIQSRINIYLSEQYG